MTVAQEPYAPVLAQAEQLVLRQREAYMTAMRERQAKVAAWEAAEAAKIEFLKTTGATPMAVETYDAWLVDFVAAGGVLTEFVNGDFPRIRMFDPNLPVNLDALVQQQGSLEEAYYGEPIIWTIDQPVVLAAMPTLHAEQCLTLHLTAQAVRGLTRAEIEVWANDTLSGDSELYVDGHWAADVWVPQAYVIRAIPYVWQENVRNMRGVGDIR